MHDTSAMSFEKVNACRMNKSFTLLAGITELDIENSNSTSERNFQFYQFIRQSFHQILSIRDSFEPIYISKLPWPIIVADLHMIETWEIWKGDYFTIHSNALKKKKKTEFAAVLRSIRGFIPSNDSGTCRGEKRVVRYDRERCLVNVSQNVSFIVCGIVFQSKETADSSFFFLPYFFLPNSILERNIRIPSGFPKNRCFAERERKKKNKSKGKDFTGASGVFETCSYNTSRPNRGFYLLFTEFTRHPPNV